MCMKKINLILDEVSRKNQNLCDHMENTSLFAFALAKKLRLDNKQKELTFFGALLHDIGKIQLSSHLVNSLDLSQQENQKNKEHVIYGSSMFMFMDGFENLSNIIKHHHEHWDGSGYPHQLQGEKIPLISRVILISSDYEVMRNKKNYTHYEAVMILRDGSGKKYDPNLIEPFIQIIVDEELV
jgi:putative nucleotidyltransferase with HDIG domain